MSELSKKVPKDSDWLFGDNIVSRINQNKAKQQSLKGDGFRDSSKPQRIDNMGTTRNSKEKDRTGANTSKAIKGNSVIERRANV